jgi:hypothetical protein
MVLVEKQQLKVKNARMELQEQLAIQTRMGAHKRIISMLQTTNFLKCVPLEPVSSTKIKAAEKQVSSEYALVNGVKTVADSVNFGTLRLLRELSCQLCQINELPLDPEEVYEAVVMRMSRTLASVDAYSKLKRIIRASNLSLVRDDGVSKSNCDVELFESGGCLYAHITTPCTFGLMRNAELKPGKVDINNNGLLVNQKKGAARIDPWLKFDVVVVERMNLTTGEGVRLARLV